MKRLLVLLGLIAIVAGVAMVVRLTDPTPSAPATTIPSSLAAPSTIPTSTTTTEPTHPEFSMTLGALPDGTEFLVTVEPALDDEPVSVGGMVVVDIDGHPNAVGPMQISFESWFETSFEDGLYRTSAGGHFVQIDFYDHVLDHLGPDAEEIIRTSIRGSIVAGYPIVELSHPFRWASDDELPAQMQVRFGTFEVRRGCGPLAVACSETRAVQVIPAERAWYPAPAWRANLVAVHSMTPRPESDDHYIDPGPLSPRHNPDVLWTGEEMIVWGGASRGGRPNLVDGAAFDPITDRWRIIAKAPIRPGRTNRAVWGGDEMIVMSTDGTFSYDPGADSWRRLGEGVDPGWSRGRLVSIGGAVFMWTNQVHVFDLASGVWSTLPDPPFEVGPEEWHTGLHDFAGHLLAVGDTEYCGVTGSATWHGGEWHMVSLSERHCSRQVATSGDRVFFWNEDESHYAIWIDGVHWSFGGIRGHGMGGMEGAGGALALDDGQILVPQFGEGAILDGTTWTQVDLPGWGTEWDMVWTGEEVLMWGVPMCCIEEGAPIDAWRWIPPQP